MQQYYKRVSQLHSNDQSNTHSHKDQSLLQYLLSDSPQAVPVTPFQNKNRSQDFYGHNTNSTYHRFTTNNNEGPNDGNLNRWKDRSQLLISDIKASYHEENQSLAAERKYLARLGTTEILREETFGNQDEEQQLQELNYFQKQRGIQKIKETSHFGLGSIKKESLSSKAKFVKKSIIDEKKSLQKSKQKKVNKYVQNEEKRKKQNVKTLKQIQKINKMQIHNIGLYRQKYDRFYDEYLKKFEQMMKEQERIIGKYTAQYQNLANTKTNYDDDDDDDTDYLNQSCHKFDILAQKLITDIQKKIVDIRISQQDNLKQCHHKDFEYQAMKMFDRINQQLTKYEKLLQPITQNYGVNMNHQQNASFYKNSSQRLQTMGHTLKSKIYEMGDNLKSMLEGYDKLDRQFNNDLVKSIQSRICLIQTRIAVGKQQQQQ